MDDLSHHRPGPDYPGLRDYESESGTPTRLIKTLRGDRHPSLYLIIKHLLLAIVFLVVIWTLLEILFAAQKDQAIYTDDMAQSTVVLVKNIVVMGRVLVVALCVFGIVGIIKESFSLSLVFSVFMFIRLVGSLYMPYASASPVSTGLICLLTLMSFLHLSLVRRTAVPEIVPPAPHSLRVAVDSDSIRV